eukprot:TRINITY_DN20114_c0_g1_i3.p2 TRINITY_DN20114_c0_g1~~TRINITY_DN20114_c0_g1_i3.p2  ORF type:complete len:129 (+),score=30.15 TRINITY_DN20114_c0_g1_i3:507-893(+)
MEDRREFDRRASEWTYCYAMPRCVLLRTLGRDFTTAEVATLLSDAGFSAETAVELAGAPPGALEPAAHGALCLFVRAPTLGFADAVALELDPAATIGGLAAAAARCLGVDAAAGSADGASGAASQPPA